ncbi:MAG: hypothetical protein WBG11_11375 [Methylocella sp.]
MSTRPGIPVATPLHRARERDEALARQRLDGSAGSPKLAGNQDNRAKPRG